MQTRSRYLIVSQKDLEWGMSVTTTGHQEIKPGSDYPPGDHPSRYLFTRKSGRILNETQLVYIVRGRGYFRSQSLGRKIAVNSGDLFILTPGEWHSYWPARETGWEEYWIGFSGPVSETWRTTGYISSSEPVIHPGVDSHLISLYQRSIEMAIEQKSTFQQVLCSIASNILFTALFLYKNRLYEEDSSSVFVSRARELIISDIASASPVSLASSLGLSYSKFRKLFKAYTGLAPGKYIAEVRIMMAKEQLTNTDMQIQEIAWNLGFENSDNFITAFKNIAGIPPGAFRTKQRLLNSKQSDL